MEVAVSTAKLSLVYSSITVSIFNFCPLAHRSNTKSYVQTWFGLSAREQMAVD